MASRRKPEQRREAGLSRARIVDAAVALLDKEGEGGLTFRALAARLETGAGAIYWHVANKGELLAAASDTVVAEILGKVRGSGEPRRAIRSIAVGVFEAVDAHAWIGAELARAPWPTATLQIFERIGRQVLALGVPSGVHFTMASALVSYIIGVSVQNAANSRQFAGTVADRAKLLEAEAARWQALDPAAYPFTRSVAAQLREHDDRAELLAGVELILSGSPR